MSYVFNLAKRTEHTWKSSEHLNTPQQYFKAQSYGVRKNAGGGYDVYAFLSNYSNVSISENLTKKEADKIKKELNEDLGAK